ncbi:MAG TPA: MFS transporter [Thermoplasmata archaeon]|nr:MFS transporter [Thermoplasmata archaeon]
MHITRITLFANVGVAASLVFIPNFARSVGATPDQIGVIFAAHSFMALLSSFAFGRYADVRGRKRVLQLGLSVSTVAALLQVFAFDPVSIGLSRAFLGFALGMYPGALVAYAYEANHLMGKFASYGSIGWAAGNFAAGVLGYAYPTQFALVFAASSAAFFLAWLYALGLTAKEERSVAVPLFPKAVIRRNLSIYLTMLIRHTGANMVWVIFPLFLQVDRGFTYLEIGIVLAFNPLVQAAVMPQLDRYRATPLVAVGIILSGLTFFLFTVAADFLQMMLVQIVLGTAWATIYVGSLKFVTERNVERATAAGLLSSVMTLSSILGPLAGGLIANVYGYYGAMYAALGMSLLALLTYVVALRNHVGTERPLPT